MELGSFTFDIDHLLAQVQAMDPDGQEAVGFLLSLVELRAQKGADYGARRDTYANYQGVADLLEVPGWHIAATRLIEKAFRLGNLMAKELHGEPPANEPIEDTLRDMALIAAICHAMRERERARD